MTESARSRSGTRPAQSRATAGRPRRRPRRRGATGPRAAARSASSPDLVDRAGVRRAGDGGDRERTSGRAPGLRRSPRRPAPPRSRKSASDGTRWSVSAGKPSSSSARPIEKWAWSRGVDPDALERSAAGRVAGPGQARRGGRRGRPSVAMKLAITPPEVRMPNGSSSAPSGPAGYPTRSVSQRTTSSSTNAPAGPACQTSTPWLGDLGEQLADDRHDQRRRREVAERGRVVGVEQVRARPVRGIRASTASAVVGEVGRGAGPACLPVGIGAEERRPQVGIAGRLADSPPEGLVVEVVEGGRPGLPAELGRAPAARRPRRGCR